MMKYSAFTVGAIAAMLGDDMVQTEAIQIKRSGAPGAPAKLRAGKRTAESLLPDPQEEDFVLEEEAGEGEGVARNGEPMTPLRMEPLEDDDDELRGIKRLRGNPIGAPRGVDRQFVTPKRTTTIPQGVNFNNEGEGRSGDGGETTPWAPSRMSEGATLKATPDAVPFLRGWEEEPGVVAAEETSPSA
jgi:hypothetical protein